MRPAKGFDNSCLTRHLVVSAASQCSLTPSFFSSLLTSLPDFISYSAFRLLFPRSLMRLHFSSFQAAEEQGRERGSFSWWQVASVPLCVTVTEISPAAWWAWSCETGLPVSLLLCVLPSWHPVQHIPSLGTRLSPLWGFFLEQWDISGFSDLSPYLLEPLF